MTQTDSNPELARICEQVDRFRAVRDRYVRYAQVLRQVLEQAARHYAPDAIVQARAKTIASFAEKVQRKKDRYPDPINQFTDLCGARVITHTPAEVRAICAFIEQSFEIDRANSIDVSQRLKPTEFGYRSVHYIVQFRRGVFPNDLVSVAIPDDLFPSYGDGSAMKAEIQVRTVLEHAWADFNHRLVYKSPFPVPARYQREFAGLAAMLEEVDNAFADLGAELKKYAATYGTYLPEAQARDEIALLETVLACDPTSLETASRIGKLAIIVGDWQKAIETLTPYAESGSAAILRDLGIAICKQVQEAHGDTRGPRYREGQAYLARAGAGGDVDALAALAGTWKDVDDRQASEYYRQAYERDPFDPYPLGNYLECEAAERRSLAAVRLLAPVIRSAIARCRDQAEVGTNLPWAFYDMGKFNLLLGSCHESLAAYAKAVQLSSQGWMIRTSLRSLDRLAAIPDAPAECDWARRLLLLGWAAKFGNAEAIERVRSIASPQGEPPSGPVVILAGGCDASVEAQMEGYRQLLVEAFHGFRGTLISGGTTAGISGLAGEVGAAYPGAIRTVGYLPAQMPPQATPDPRYAQIRRTTGQDFSPLEPLQYWADLIVAGIRPDQVRLLGINGGTIASIEYRLALALGARVAAIEGSGRAAAALLADNDWRIPGRIPLPADPQLVAAFISPASPRLEPSAMREAVARAIHQRYTLHEAHLGPDEDPALAEWINLRDDLKESNRLQADHIAAKLRRIGCSMHRADMAPVSAVQFSEEEVEIMAQMEHARWVVERLLAGWTCGPRRDLVAKTNPYLVPWSALPDDVKEWDRETVRRIPEFLARAGWEVRREA